MSLRPLTFRIHARNHGQTPALNFAILSMNHAILAFPLPDAGELGRRDFPDPDPHPTHRIALHPGEKVGVLSSMHLPRLSDADIEAVNTPILVHPFEHPPQLYCFGTAEYWDVFGTQHWLHFAAMYGGDLTVRPTGDKEKRIAARCHVYNDLGDGPTPPLAQREG